MLDQNETFILRKKDGLLYIELGKCRLCCRVLRRWIGEKSVALLVPATNAAAMAMAMTEMSTTLWWFTPPDEEGGSFIVLTLESFDAALLLPAWLPPPTRPERFVSGIAVLAGGIFAAAGSSEDDVEEDPGRRVSSVEVGSRRINVFLGRSSSEVFRSSS